jgi:outer membrane protein OmpA-like peptidoglycan-associated protein
MPAPPVAQGQPPKPATGRVPVPTSAQGQPIRRVEGLRTERREERDGNRTIIREPDRVIVREGGRTIIRHNETDRFRYGARDIRTERRGNEHVTIVERGGGVRIITVTSEDGRLIRRVRRYPDGREVVIIENRWRPGIGVAAGVAAGAAGLVAAGYFLDMRPPEVRVPRRRYIIETETATPEEVYGILMAPPIERLERPYSLEEIRYNAPLRARMPSVDIDTITFETGSWEVSPDQVNRLAVIADSINRAIQANPSEVFLLEGHTDATGNDVDNLSLSDRRAEAVALLLSEQFQVPAENLTTQGYGEQALKIPTDGPERRNRRVTARRITPLLTGDSGNAGQAPN